MRHNLKWFIVSLVLSAAGIAFVAGILSERDLFAAARQVPFPFIAYGIGVSVTTWVIEALRIRTLLLALNERLPLWTTLRLNLASNFVAGITPASSGGPPAQTYFLGGNGVPLPKAIVLVSTRMILTAAFFGVTVPVATIFFGQDLALPPSLLPVAQAVGWLILFGTVFSYYLASRPRLLSASVEGLLTSAPGQAVMRLVGRYARRDPAAAAATARKVARDLSRSFRLVADAPPALILQIVILTLAFWVAFFAIGPLLLEAFGVEVPYAMVFIRQVVVYFLVAYVPLPGGSGVAELGLAYAFSSFLRGGQLLSFVALWRLLTYFLPIFVGAVFFALESRKLATRR